MGKMVWEKWYEKNDVRKTVLNRLFWKDCFGKDSFGKDSFEKILLNRHFWTDFFVWPPRRSL